MNASPDISILICTHNRADVLAQTLDSLAAMRIPSGVGVEVVVIANACTDNTERVVAAKAGSLAVPMRCVVESTPGLSRARNRALAEARGGIMAYIDDDVWLETDWVEGLLEAYKRDGADMVGGKVTLWWQAIAQPDWMDDRTSSLLNRRDHGDTVIELFDPNAALGANFSFRRKVWEAVGDFRLDLGRTGKDNNASEESEFLERALKKGFRMFYAPRASLRHWVAPQRVTPEYLCSAAVGNAQSRVYAKEPFRLRQAARSIVGHTYLMLRHLPAESLAGLRGDKREWLFHRIRRVTGSAGLGAALRRTLGFKR